MPQSQPSENKGASGMRRYNITLRATKWDFSESESDVRHHILCHCDPFVPVCAVLLEFNWKFYLSVLERVQRLIQ